MPKKCLRSIVDLSIHAVTCPGVWLPRRDDVYLRITLFNQVRHSQITGPVFPLLLHERFNFDKTFYTAFEPSQVADRLKDEFVDIELIQLSNAHEGGKLLASYYSNARDFLYPYPTYSTNYGARDREILLDRSIEFPGIQPKLEFSSRTVIKEVSSSPSSLDEYNFIPVTTLRPKSPTVRLSRANSPTFRKNGYSQPTVSSVSRSTSPVLQSRQGLMPSLRKRLDALDLSPPYDVEDRPPFVVRKQKGSPSLISRTPGESKKHPQYPPLIKSKRSKSKSRSRGRSRSFSAGDLSASLDDYFLRRSNKSVNYSTSRSINNGLSDSDDSEVLELTDPTYRRTGRGRSPNRVSHSYSVPARSPSPLSYKSSLKDRYDPRPYSPATSDIISRRVDGAITRNRSPYSSYRRSLRSFDDDTIEGLARDLEFARSRRYY